VDAVADGCGPSLAGALSQGRLCCRSSSRSSDLPLQFLRLPPELHPPQLAQQQLPMFDLGLARLQPRVRRDVFLVFRYQHRLQPFPIQRAQVGKCGDQHDAQYAMN
jgi:hypothetical protein